MNLEDMNWELAEYFDQDDEVVEIRHAAIEKRTDDLFQLRAIVKKKARHREKREAARLRRLARQQAELERNQGLANAS